MFRSHADPCVAAAATCLAYYQVMEKKASRVHAAILKAVYDGEHVSVLFAGDVVLFLVVGVVTDCAP